MNDSSLHEFEPEFDGFAYPREPREDCSCTQDPLDPMNAIICDHCFNLLLAQ